MGCTIKVNRNYAIPSTSKQGNILPERKDSIIVEVLEDKLVVKHFG
jgi:hypothetical protein